MFEYVRISNARWCSCSKILGNWRSYSLDTRKICVRHNTKIYRCNIHKQISQPHAYFCCFLSICKITKLHLIWCCTISDLNGWITSRIFATVWCQCRKTLKMKHSLKTSLKPIIDLQHFTQTQMLITPRHQN